MCGDQLTLTANYITIIPTCLQIESPDNPMSTSSSEKLSDGIPEVRKKAFYPSATQRGEGQPSAKLKEHLGMGSTRSSNNWSLQK